MRTIIIDDNEIERLNLRLLLQTHHPAIEFAGEAACLDSAVDLINEETPDLIFLDVHLENQLGFTAIEKTGCKSRVIITTAHPKYAIRAFDINAIDYLLKPIMEENLARALVRIPELGPGSNLTRVNKLQLEDIQLFKRKDGLDAMPVSEIILITGERIYTKVRLRDGREYLHNRPLREWIRILPENVFKALDRSRIVNLREIRGLNDTGNGGYELSFRSSDYTIRIKRTAVKSLRNLL
jgi:two-component system, LytTR family, response regulator